LTNDLSIAVINTLPTNKILENEIEKNKAQKIQKSY